MPSILFICVHNACRSQIAEAICRRLAPPSWLIASAGTHPSADMDRKAAEILGRYELTMFSTRPKGFEVLRSIRWDYVVDITYAGERCDMPTKHYLRWDVPDPFDGPIDNYDKLYHELAGRVRALIGEIDGRLS
jgi:arsenate reductase